MKFDSLETTITMQSAYTIADTNVIDVGFYGGDSYSAMVTATVDTPSNKTFAAAAVNIGTEVITLTSHGYQLGLKVQISNPGALPTGISASTDYFVIPLTTDTFQLASTLNNALAGTSINITAQGSGTNTVNVTAVAGANVKLQQSNDMTIWIDLGSATNITTTANIYLEKDRPTSRYIRLYLTLTAGHISLSSAILVKGDKG